MESSYHSQFGVLHPHLPQQFSNPHLESLESTPATGRSVIRTVPVLWNPLGFTPSSTALMTASTAISPIRMGNCMTVAPIVPSAMLRTPEQLPSIEVTHSTGRPRKRRLGKGAPRAILLKGAVGQRARTSGRGRVRGPARKSAATIQH